MSTQKPDDYWKDKLSSDQYHVLREKGTEAPYSGEYVDTYDDGTYHCAACGNKLFNSTSKYESTLPGLLGWPSFGDIANDKSVILQEDRSLGMVRQEVVCANCGSHLGHLFDDHTSSTGKHYCINSISLDFKPKNSLVFLFIYGIISLLDIAAEKV